MRAEVCVQANLNSGQGLRAGVAARAGAQSTAHVAAANKLTADHLVARRNGKSEECAEKSGVQHWPRREVCEVEAEFCSAKGRRGGRKAEARARANAPRPFCVLARLGDARDNGVPHSLYLFLLLILHLALHNPT